ncbi:hypothetical protein HKX48_007922 [Thoreauomyces humboldtii]|nr:hypothetical protein HKX48_007922 [Thoreauomyces humboldtii]
MTTTTRRNSTSSSSSNQYAPLLPVLADVCSAAVLQGALDQAAEQRDRIGTHLEDVQKHRHMNPKLVEDLNDEWRRTAKHFDELAIQKNQGLEKLARKLGAVIAGEAANNVKEFMAGFVTGLAERDARIANHFEELKLERQHDKADREHLHAQIIALQKQREVYETDRVREKTERGRLEAQIVALGNCIAQHDQSRVTDMENKEQERVKAFLALEKRLGADQISRLEGLEASLKRMFADKLKKSEAMTEQMLLDKQKQYAAQEEIRSKALLALEKRLVADQAALRGTSELSSRRICAEKLHDVKAEIEEKLSDRHHEARLRIHTVEESLNRLTRDLSAGTTSLDQQLTQKVHTEVDRALQNRLEKWNEQLQVIKSAVVATTAFVVQPRGALQNMAASSSSSDVQAITSSDPVKSPTRTEHLRILEQHITAEGIASGTAMGNEQLELARMEEPLGAAHSAEPRSEPPLPPQLVRQHSVSQRDRLSVGHASPEKSPNVQKIDHTCKAGARLEARVDRLEEHIKLQDRIHEMDAENKDKDRAKAFLALERRVAADQKSRHETLEVALKRLVEEGLSLVKEQLKGLERRLEILSANFTARDRAEETARIGEQLEAFRERVANLETVAERQGPDLNERVALLGKEVGRIHQCLSTHHRKMERCIKQMALTISKQDVDLATVKVTVQQLIRENRLRLPSSQQNS